MEAIIALLVLALVITHLRARRREQELTARLVSTLDVTKALAARVSRYEENADASARIAARNYVARIEATKAQR